MTSPALPSARSCLVLLAALTLGSLACGDDDDSSPAATTAAGGSAGQAGGAGQGGGSAGSGGAAGSSALCAGSTPEQLMGCVSSDRYRQDVEAIAVERTPDTGPWLTVQDRCATVLAGLGFTVERHAYATGVNVVGTLPGTDRADELVLLGAHYDHIDGCHGADDNATGVAAVLEAARVLAGHGWSRSLAVACWDEEELGCLGSKAWATRARSQGQTLQAVYNFDMIGYTDAEPYVQVPPSELQPLFPGEYTQLENNEFRGDFVLLMHDTASLGPAASFEKYFEKSGRIASRLLVPGEYLKTLDEVRRSDHRSFWDRDFPAIMITDTGDSRNPGYHCKKDPDDLASLDYPFALDV
ncbi:MAG: M20/M25/M40 family metallo-hydrolase, partial [Myxococcales bacterium]